MAPSWLTLVEDEAVVWTDHPSIYAYLDGLLLGLGIALVGIAVALSGLLSTVSTGVGPAGSVIGVLVVALGAGVVAVTHLRRTSTVYVLTTVHVYKKAGILGREVDPIRVDRIADMEYRQSIAGRLLGIGDVRITTAGTGGTDMTLEAVPSVRAFTTRLSRELDRQRPPPRWQ